MISRAELRNRQESPVRIFGLDPSGQAINVSAWTMDVSRHGARIRGVRDFSAPGETVGVRHGMEKARFQIVWVGTPGTASYGQIGLRCVEDGKYIWGIAAPEASAARPANMQTGSFPSPAPHGRFAIGLAPAVASTNNRRKDSRYRASGGAKITEVGAPAGQWATLHDLSMGGCYVETTSPLPPTTRVDVVLHIDDVQITARGAVTVCHRLVGMGVEFKEVSSLNRARIEQIMIRLMQTSTEA
ncbi:MAG: PilZ domain-containing protein [Terriglobales bacterium]